MRPPHYCELLVLGNKQFLNLKETPDSPQGGKTPQGDVKARAQVTFSANKSLSKLCPINMVSALNMFSRTAWTSRRVMLVFSRSSSVTPENLQSNTRQVGLLHLKKHLKAQSPSALKEWWPVEFQQVLPATPSS